MLNDKRSTPVNEDEPNSRFWPNSETVSFACPWCSAATETSIAGCREDGLAGRLDDCPVCAKIIIIEAYKDGTRVFKGVAVG